MTVKLKDKLGTGIYSLSEAALYAKVSTGLLARWLYGNRKGRAVVSPQYGGEKVVGFLDFVQAIAIHEIRMQQKIHLNKFREAVQVAQSIGMEYPFAMEHTTFLLDDTIVIRRKEDDKPPEFIEASGKHRGQRLFIFVESYLQNLKFTDGLASEYTIYTSERGVPIKMNPGFRFGEPLLPSRYSALTIWEAVAVEGGIDRAAEAYGIEEKEVDAAYKFFVNYLGKVAA